MQVLRHHVKKTLPNALTSRMCAEEHLSPFATSVRSEDTRSRTLVRSYTEAVDYLLGKYETDQAIVENDATFLCYDQTSNVTPQQYTDDQGAKYCNAADEYDERTLNKEFMEVFFASFSHILSNY